MIKKEIKIIACVLVITFFIGLWLYAKNESFWINIVSTLIGALGALLIFYLGLNIKKKQEDEIKNEELAELYQRYKRELGENVTFASDLTNTNTMSPYKFRTLIRDNSWGRGYKVDLDLMKKLEHFYIEVDRIIQLLSKIDYSKEEKNIDLRNYTEAFQQDVNTAAGRIIEHGQDCIDIIDSLLNKS